VRTSRAFPLDRGGPERLTLSWEGPYGDARAALDGVDCASFDTAKLRRRGDTVALPDGSKLFVRVRGLLGLEVRRDGVALPGSDFDPKIVLRNAGILLVVIGGPIDAMTDAVRVSRGGPIGWPVWLDGAMLVLGVATALGLRFALALGAAAFVTRIALLPERSTLTLMFGVIGTWLLANHFFAASPRKR